MPEAQGAGAHSRNCELLVEGAVAICLVVHEAAETVGRVAYEAGKRAAVCLHIRHNRRRVLI
jgi:hypothetical protein